MSGDGCMTQAKAQSHEQALLPAYLAVGSDELKRRRIIERLKTHLDESLRDFNLDEREASGDMEPESLLTSLMALPFGPGQRLVIITHAERLPKAVSEMIVSYLGEPNPTTVLLLVAEALAKNTRLYKAVAKISAKAIMDCSPKRRSELPAMVSRMAASHGKHMDHAAAAELVSLVGESTVLLDAQVNTLCEIVDPEDEITLADVKHHVKRVAEVKPWDFLDAVSARDLSQALSLYAMMEKPSHFFLLTLICGRMRELMCARSLEARGEISSLAQVLKRASWQVRSLPGWARNYSYTQLSHAFRLCADAERALKNGADPDATFVQLVSKLCSNVA